MIRLKLNVLLDSKSMIQFAVLNFQLNNDAQYILILFSHTFVLLFDLPNQDLYHHV